MSFSRSSRPPKWRLPLVLNRTESEVLDRALLKAIDDAVPGSDDLALLYTLLRKNERIKRKLQDSDPASSWEDD